SDVHPCAVCGVNDSLAHHESKPPPKTEGCSTLVRDPLLCQPVAYATHGVQIYRPVRVGLDLLANHANVDVERSLIAVEGGTPNTGEQLLAFDDAAGRLGQEPQDVELTRRHIDPSAITRQLSYAGVDAQRSHGIHAVASSA